MSLRIMYFFPVSVVYRRPDSGLQLEPQHVAMNKWIKTSVVCD